MADERVDEDKQSLVDRLEELSDESFASGRVNNLWHIWLSIFVILASLVATVLAAADVPHVVLAGAAALPAAFAAAQKIFQPRRLSQWYFLKSTRLAALSTDLSFNKTPDLGAYAKRLAEIELEMEELWKTIGEDTVPPSLTHQRRNRWSARAAKRATKQSPPLTAGPG